MASAERLRPSDCPTKNAAFFSRGSVRTACNGLGSQRTREKSFVAARSRVRGLRVSTRGHGWDPSRTVIEAGDDVVRMYTEDEEKRLALNLEALLDRIHRGDLCSVPLTV